MTAFASREDSSPEGYAFVPLDVSEAVLDGASPLKAWRQYRRLTQDQMAERMGITRPAYTQMEAAEKPRPATMEKAAQALAINLEQLLELYDDEPVTAPEDKS